MKDATKRTPPTVTEPWRDEGGHAWEIQLNVTCVECPHCCFVFAAVHTDGYSNGYSCPNCKGCPEAVVTEAGEQEFGDSLIAAINAIKSISEDRRATALAMLNNYFAAPPSTSAAIRAAAEEIASYLFANIGGVSENQEAEIAAILSRWFGRGETEQENKNA